MPPFILSASFLLPGQSLSPGSSSLGQIPAFNPQLGGQFFYTFCPQCFLCSAPRDPRSLPPRPGTVKTLQGSYHRLSQLSPARCSAQGPSSRQHPRPAESQGWCGKRFHWNPLGDKRPLLCSGQPAEHAWQKWCGWRSHLQKEGRGDEAGGAAAPSFRKEHGFPSENTQPLGIPWQSSGLGLGAFTARGPGSIPGWGTKIPQAVRHGQKKKENTQPESMHPRIQVIPRAQGSQRACFHPNVGNGEPYRSWGQWECPPCKLPCCQGGQCWLERKVIQGVGEGNFYQCVQQGGGQTSPP